MSSRAKTSNKIKAINFLKKMTISAFMMGLSIVFARFISIYIPLGGMPSMRFSLGNLPIIITSLVCGPFWGMVVGAGADLIGATAFPVGACAKQMVLDACLCK
jgi:ECF transporter S component (folate family)